MGLLQCESTYDELYLYYTAGLIFERSLFPPDRDLLNKSINNNIKTSHFMQFVQHEISTWSSDYC